MYKVSLTAFLKPKYAPMNVRGTEIQNHRANMATRVPNGMAAEEPSPHKIRFITKKSANTTLSTDTTLRNRRLNEWQNYMDVSLHAYFIGSSSTVQCLYKQKQAHPGQRNDVSKTLVFHFSPPNADIVKTGTGMKLKKLYLNPYENWNVASSTPRVNI